MHFNIKLRYQYQLQMSEVRILMWSLLFLDIATVTQSIESANYFLFMFQVSSVICNLFLS